MLGTQVLLDHARHAQLRLVQVSTDEVYGDIPLGAPACTEDAPLRPSSPYSASKAGGDLQVLAYVRTYGVDALVTRGANTYGPRQYPEKFLPLFITNAFDGQPLPVYGDGKQRREWLHVEDHCAAIELVLRQGAAGEVYNVGGQERENMDVVRRILDLTGASPDLVRHVADRPGHDRRYAVDSSKLRGLGWRPRTPSTRAGWRRRSSGTARTASGGSRSSPASTAATTTSSTPPASASEAFAAPKAGRHASAGNEEVAGERLRAVAALWKRSVKPRGTSLDLGYRGRRGSPRPPARRRALLLAGGFALSVLAAGPALGVGPPRRRPRRATTTARDDEPGQGGARGRRARLGARPRA